LGEGHVHGLPRFTWVSPVFRDGVGEVAGPAFWSAALQCRFSSFRRNKSGDESPHSKTPPGTGLPDNLPTLHLVIRGAAGRDPPWASRGSRARRPARPRGTSP